MDVNDLSEKLKRIYRFAMERTKKNLILPTHVHTMTDFSTMFSTIEPIQNYPTQDQKS